MTTAKHAVKTLFQALHSPCDGCTNSEICEMNRGCADYKFYFRTNRYRFLDRRPIFTRDECEREVA